MTSTNFPAPPSKNPANVDTLPGTMEVVLTKFLQNIDNMLPVNVLAYDRTTNVAQVQPLIQMVTTLGEQINRAQIAAVPVFQYGGGGFVVSCPLDSGDLGWVHANDRDISLFLQSGLNSPPNTNRKHSFSDGMLFPDTMLKNVQIAAEDAGNLVIQNDAGTVKIALWANQIKTLAPNSCVTDTTSYAPNSHCVLDVQSTSKAFKFPVMSTAQKNAIASPTSGMAVYDTGKPGLSVYTTGTGWS